MDDEMLRVDINRADVAELTQIPGIGESLARRIIEYRETVHPFEEVIELAAVPGISERMVRNFADRLTVEPMAVVERTATPPTLALEPVSEPPSAEPEAPPEPAPVEEIIDAEAAAETAAEVETAEPELEAEVELEMEPLTLEELEEPEPLLETRVAEFEAEVETAVPIAEPAPVPPPVATPAQVQPQRPWGLFALGTILGAFLGALLSLAILAALNRGTLAFNRADVSLRAAIQDAQQTQADLARTVENVNTELNANLSAVATRTGDLATQQQETAAMLQELSAGLAAAQEDVASLGKVTDELDERLTTVSTAAETFDTFLNRLRDMLLDLQGTPEPTSTPTASPEPTATMTPIPTEEGGGGQATAVPTSTVRPTRTPRPTATPIKLPTSTPSQQP